MRLGRLLLFADVPTRPERLGKSTGRVVQIGKDPELLRLRGKLLANAGHRVRSFPPEQARAEMERADDSQLWIFCHTLAFYELADTAHAIRSSRPATRLLLLAGLHRIGPAATLFNEILKPAAGVDELLAIVASLVCTPAAEQSR